MATTIVADEPRYSANRSAGRIAATVDGAACFGEATVCTAMLSSVAGGSDGTWMRADGMLRFCCMRASVDVGVGVCARACMCLYFGVRACMPACECVYGDVGEWMERAGGVGRWRRVADPHRSARPRQTHRRRLRQSKEKSTEHIVQRTDGTANCRMRLAGATSVTHKAICDCVPCVRPPVRLGVELRTLMYINLGLERAGNFPRLPRLRCRICTPARPVSTALPQLNAAAHPTTEQLRQ